MKKLCIVAAVTIAMFVLAAPPAFAAVEARVLANGPHTISRGVATVDLFVDCTDPRDRLRPADERDANPHADARSPIRDEGS
jgi:hypothetical protein